MICQACGKCIKPIDMFIVHFSGIFIPIDAKWICCNPCAADITRELDEHFSEKALNSVNIYAFRTRSKKMNNF